MAEKHHLQSFFFLTFNFSSNNFISIAKWTTRTAFVKFSLKDILMFIGTGINRTAFVDVTWML